MAEPGNNWRQNKDSNPIPDWIPEDKQHLYAERGRDFEPGDDEKLELHQKAFDITPEQERWGLAYDPVKGPPRDKAGRVIDPLARTKRTLNPISGRSE